jgi:lysine 2,3-aminomutase
MDAARGVMSMNERVSRTAEDLAEADLIEPERIAALDKVAARYAVAITPHIRDLIGDGGPDNPIARQFVPHETELDAAAIESADPIGDERHSPVEGIVHRYRDRVLLKLTRVCAVYCRFCFRRETVGRGKSQVLSPCALDRAIAYIRAQPEIWEVIVTGGDPFVLSPRRLADVKSRLSGIGHVKVLRWHTRVPIVDPKRITSKLVRAIATHDRAAFVAVHVNHARELSPDVRRACARLIDAGIPLLSQSVLLRGVNDDADTLEALMRALVETRIKPYYLHHPDLARGTAQFRTTIAEGQTLIRELRGRASGLCQPGYVLDIPGGHAKANLAPSDIDGEAGSYRLRDGNACWHSYPLD